MILELQLTPTEVRELAVYACVEAEMQSMRALRLPFDHVPPETRAAALKRVSDLKAFLEDDRG